MAVLPFEVKNFKEMDQLVLPQPRTHETDVFQGVEIAGIGLREIDIGTVAFEIVKQDLIVILHIMAYQHLAFAVVHEHLQSFSAGMAFAVAVDLQHGIGVAAHSLGELLVGL